MLKNKLQFILFLSMPFLIAIPAHFLYELLPFPLFAIYFPINESIFEHIKLIFTPIIITYLIFYLFKKKNIDLDKYLSSLIISIFSSLVIMLLTYYLSYSILKKDIVIISILCLFISIISSQYLSLYTYQKNIKWSKEISIYVILTFTFTLLILTVNPPSTPFFKSHSS